LTATARVPIPCIVSRPDGRSGFTAGEVKSGLRGRAVPDNVRRVRAQGKCHREQTAAARCVPTAARVKRCGKSAPRRRQRRWHGKPHREQDRIGAARGLGAKAQRTSRSVSRPAVRVGCWRRRVTGVQEEWPSRMRACSHAIQNPAYRLADLYLRASGAIPPDARQVLSTTKFSWPPALWHTA
jgi:hypothetical protein